MATIKQILGANKSERLYALKDQLKAERVLDLDPMQLNRTKFTMYLAAKAEALILDYTKQGYEVDAAFRKAEMYLTIIDSQWREEAKNHNIARKSDMWDVVVERQKASAS